MLKLITEHVEDVQFLTEDKDGVKEYFIEGIFMQAEKKNRNGRKYPNKVLMKEANRYQKEYVEQNRAMGELGHPPIFIYESSTVKPKSYSPMNDN